jgi:chorismate dehydratase
VPWLPLPFRSADWHVLDGVVETVGRFGIAADGESMSVLLFSRVPFDAMHRPRTLRVTGETASSVRLLYLLLGQRHGFTGFPNLPRMIVTRTGTADR